MPGLEQTIAAHHRATKAFADLLRTVPGDKPIPGLEWTAGELGAHVLRAAAVYERAAVEGVDVWPDLTQGAVTNAEELTKIPDRDSTVIADKLATAFAPVYDAWRRADGPIHWAGGLMLPVEVVAGLQLGDVSVHGWDLARAAKAKWDIPREEAVLCLDAALSIAPHFLAPGAAGFTGTYDVRLRGDGRHVLAFDNGALRVDPADAPRADCRLSADPATFLLASYGRVPVWRTAVTGAVMAMGRKPWLAFRFKSLLRSP
jgi:uncharacterized protein (TIGR03083 family)